VDLLDLMDAIQVHAAAAAVTAGGAKFYDVAVGFPAARGKCVRIFYGGEREPERMGGELTLTSQMVAQAINVRGYWPVSETAAKNHRVIEGEMAAFVKSLRTRILGDSQLGGEGVDLAMHLAVTDQVLVTGIQYAVVDMEIVCDFDEHTRDK
jgi:hypothetical protein